MEKVSFSKISVGDEIPELVKKVTLLDLVQYAAATWNFFLAHIDKGFAQKQGFQQVNIPAAYFGACLTKLVSDWIKDPGQIKKLGYRVIRMSFVDDTLKFKGKVSKKYQEAGQNFVDCELWVENQEGVQVATATAAVSLLG
jgi:acyl dehydratase